MPAGTEQEGTIDRKEVIPTLIMGTLPVVTGESLLRIQLPAALVLLGPVLGIVHVALNLFSALIQTAAALVYIHLRRRWDMTVHTAGNLPENVTATTLRLDWAAARAGCRRAIPTLKRVLPATILAVVVFWFFTETGMLVYIGAVFDPLLRLIGLPGQAAAALVGQFLHFSAGHAVVAGLVTEGTLTFEQAVVTLILGNMVIITMIYAKYSVPLYLSFREVWGAGGGNNLCREHGGKNSDHPAGHGGSVSANPAPLSRGSLRAHGSRPKVEITCRSHTIFTIHHTRY